MPELVREGFGVPRPQQVGASNTNYRIYFLKLHTVYATIGESTQSRDPLCYLSLTRKSSL